ncbi:hypothetical protein V6N11_043557 [Hibiscus sabdariffa]|uniref:Uncharacterized protein n=1 Tax=Hibiscus sabdariffa TaxID=183260 RepID=A0ABR2RCW0_9ROSI
MKTKLKYYLLNFRPGYLDGLGDAVEQGAGPSEGCWCLKLQSFNLSLTASSSSFASISAYSNPELSVSSIRAINRAFLSSILMGRGALGLVCLAVKVLFEMSKVHGSGVS